MIFFYLPIYSFQQIFIGCLALQVVGVVSTMMNKIQTLVQRRQKRSVRTDPIAILSDKYHDVNWAPCPNCWGLRKFPKGNGIYVEIWRTSRRNLGETGKREVGEIQIEKLFQVEEIRLSEGEWCIPETTSLFFFF